MTGGKEVTTWHTRPDKQTPYGPGTQLPAPLSTFQGGAPVLSADGTALYFHARHLDGPSEELDLWVSRQKVRP